MIARFDNHPYAGRRAFFRVHDAHLVIDEQHLVEPWIIRNEGLAECRIERVHGAIAFAHGVFDRTRESEFHRGFGDRRTQCTLFDVHPIREAVEPRLVGADDLLDDDVERPLGGLELVPGILQILHAIQNR